MGMAQLGDGSGPPPPRSLVIRMYATSLPVRPYGNFGTSVSGQSMGLSNLFVVSDAAAQFADLGYEAYLWKRRRSGAWLWKHVTRHLSDLTFRLLRRGVDRL